LGHSVVVSDVINGMAEEAVAPPRVQQARGAKLFHQKYFMTNEYRNEYDKL